MRYRFTIKELEEMSNKELLEKLIIERKSTVTNVNSPLMTRLYKLQNWVLRNIKS